jgi:hypothetical protein
MGIIKELDDLPKATKNFIVCILGLMPFWYISIFIFNTHLYYHAEVYLLLSLSFCFSLLWYVVSIVLNTLSFWGISVIFDEAVDPPEQ